MTPASLRPDLADLLSQAGARPPRCGRGKWTCPECSRPDLSVNLDTQLFKCFHSGCDFRGGIGTLRKRLGLAREWVPHEEYIRQCRERERIHDAAARLHAAREERRFRVLTQVKNLNRVERWARRRLKSNLEGRLTWGALAFVYAARPSLLAELAALEDASASDLFRFLMSDVQTRKAVLERVLSRGGFYAADKRFVEVNP